MFRGWQAIYDDGTVVTEEKTHWSEVDINRIVSLSLIRDGRKYALPAGHRGWVQAKTATVVVGSSPEIQSRYVGFEEGNSQVILRVMEDTGDCIIEVCPKQK